MKQKFKKENFKKKKETVLKLLSKLKSNQPSR